MSKKALCFVNASLREKVNRSLKEAGFKVTSFEDVEEGRNILAHNHYDLVIFQFPADMKYTNCVNQIRHYGDHAILVLVDADDYNWIVPFMEQADDAMLTTFNEQELAARANALVKYPRAPWHNKAVQENKLFFSGLCIFVDDYTVMYERKPIKMTKIEFEILRLLAAHPNRIVERDTIYAKVWDEYADVENAYKNISNHIQRLRKKLEKASKYDYIRVERGVGYVFSPPPPEVTK